MIKEYIINNDIHRVLMKSQYKKHPKWAKRRLVRTILFLIPVALAVFVFLFLYDNKEYSAFIDASGHVSTANTILNALTFASSIFVLTLIPYICYYKSIKDKCDDEVMFKHREVLFLTESGIRNGFNPRLNSGYTAYNINEINYTDIIGLVFNEYHSRLTVHGKVKVTCYDNYEENRIRYTKEYEGGGRRFYMYYYNSDNFINTLSERTNIPVETVCFAEE
jgi:hypothetical protein